MTGSVQKKNNKFYLVVNIKQENGETKPKWIKTGLDIKGNKKNAVKMLNDFIAKYDNSKVLYSDISFVDFMEKWLKSVKESIRQNTYDSYKIVFDVHIKPYFNQIQLHDLSPLHIQEYYNIKINSGLSACTVLKHHANIHKALEYALRLNLIPFNPAERVMLPKKKKYTTSFYDENQLRELFKCIKGNRLEELIYFTATYGLRRSEALGLKWDAINFKKKTLTIYHTAVSSANGMLYEDSTKTHSSCRTLPLTDEIIILLKKLQVKQAANKLLYGNTYKDNNYIFKWEDGRLFSGDYVSRTFKKILEANNLSIIRFHDLRHSAASLLINLGFSLKEIQEYLGHGDIATTSNIYAHLQFKSKEQMANRISSELVI